MPEHLIFDYFTPQTETDETIADQSPHRDPLTHHGGCRGPTARPAGLGAGSRPGRTGSLGGSQHAAHGDGRPAVLRCHPTGCVPYQRAVRVQPLPAASARSGRPGAPAGTSGPVPAQGPPRGAPPPPPGYRPGPQTQPYGTRGPGGPGGGYPPGPSGSGSGPLGSRRRLIIIIAGIVVLIGAAVALGIVISGRSKPAGVPSPSVLVPPPSSTSPTPSGRDADADGHPQCECDPERWWHLHPVGPDAAFGGRDSGEHRHRPDGARQQRRATPVPGRHRRQDQPRQSRGPPPVRTPTR